ncbi:hypothetical protein D9757_014806 [Collybiopsis confluens]|uniref:Chromo domain-containing protein n=1 Tax=Collybiopsis confluens TaxID=2823264 RepID=A0A8H5CQW7_9AGAR|nr:hypothetical protein D9757_014806 [Collybiopsis confluens]
MRRMDDSSSESTASLNPCGHLDIHKIIPLRPSPLDFVHTTFASSDYYHSLPKYLSPPEPAEPPMGFHYPHSPDWHLEQDGSYSSGFCYKTKIPADAVALMNEETRQMSICAPPGVDPVWKDDSRSYSYPPAPGCVCLPPSVPLRLDVVDTTSESTSLSPYEGSFTHAAYFTLESINSTYPEVSVELEAQAKKLYGLIFGVPSDLAAKVFPLDSPTKILEELNNGSRASLPSSSGSNPSSKYWIQTPILAHNNLKQNNRSNNSGTRNTIFAGSNPSLNGSYSIASTIEEGHGVGTLKPVTQVATDEYKDQVADILIIINRIYQLLMPRAISKFEWEIMRFQCEDNNIFTSGGLGPGPVAVQMNVSDTCTSITGSDLANEIGRPQGSLHADGRDAATWKTLCIIMLNIPKGAAGGSFMLARYGVQIPFTDNWIVFLIFDGRSIHGGRNVCIHPENVAQDKDYRYVDPKKLDFSYLQNNHQEELEFLLISAVKRVALVAYIPEAAAYRLGNIAVSPSVDFGNTGTLTLADSKVKTFTGGGEYLLGSPQHAQTRLVREAVLSFINSLHHSGMNLVFTSVQDMAKLIDGAADVIPMEWDPLDPSKREQILKYRQYFAYLYKLQTHQLLPITRTKFFFHQDKLLKALKASISENPSSSSIHAQTSVIRTSPRTIFHGPNLTPHGPQTRSSKQSHPRAHEQTSSAVSKAIDAPAQNISKEPKTRPSKTSAGKKRKSVDVESVSDVGQSNSKPKKRKMNNGRTKRVDTSDINDTGIEDVGKVGEEYFIGEDGFQDYVAEKIVKHEYVRGTYWFLVKFEGYPVDQLQSWYREIDLGNASEILSDYLKSISLNLENFCSDDTVTYRILSDLFSIKTIKTERDRLNKLRESFFASRISWSAATSHANWVKLAEAHDRQNTLTHLLINNPSDTLASKGEKFQACLERVDITLQTIPSLDASVYLTHLEGIFIHWQVCRNILILYDFLAHGLPELIEALADTYKRDSKLLEPTFAGMGRLFKALVSHVNESKSQNKRQQTQTTKKTRSSVSTNLASSAPPPEFNSKFTFDPASYAIPLILRTSKSSISVPYKASRKDYRCEKEMLYTIIESHFIIPYLRRSNLWGAEEKSDNALIDHLWVRGALLCTLLEFMGSEDICAFTGITAILRDPGASGVFVKRESYHHIALSIRKNHEQAISHIRNWLQENVHHDFLLLVSGLSTRVHWYMQELVSRKKISEAEYKGEEEVPSHSPQSSRQAKKSDDCRTLTLEDLIGARDRISFGVIGIIIAEVFAEARTLPFQYQPLRWYLQGKDPSSGTELAGGDRDQTDPRRRVNAGAILFSQHLPSTRLTARTGLSNLLSWFGTGQGNLTSSFMNHITQMPGQPTFWSGSVSTLITKFHSAGVYNERLLIQNQLPVSYQQESLPVKGALRLSNCRIYGTASNLLKLVPTQNHTSSSNTITTSSRFNQYLYHRFDIYWAPNVQEAWVQFLGEMLDKNPATYTGYRSSWLDCIKLLKNLHISGFQQSLTAMQLANSLAIADIVRQPTLDEMAYWIWTHDGFGAFRGLKILGFQMPTQKAVLVALTCFTTHIWKMNDDQLTILGCKNGSVIDSEHFLCKISRWSKKVNQLNGWASKAENDIENFGNYPFPLTASREFVQDVLVKVQSSYGKQIK